MSTKFSFTKTSIIAAISISGALLLNSQATKADTIASTQITTQKVDKIKSTITTEQSTKASKLSNLEESQPSILTNPNNPTQGMESNGVKYDTSLTAANTADNQSVGIGHGSKTSNAVNGLIDYNKVKNLNVHISYDNTNNKDIGLNVDYNGLINANNKNVYQIDTSKMDLSKGLVLQGNKGDTIAAVIRLNQDALKDKTQDYYHELQWYVNNGYTDSEVLNNARYIWFNGQLKTNESYSLDIPIVILDKNITDAVLKNNNNTTLSVNEVFTYIDNVGGYYEGSTMTIRAAKPIVNTQTLADQKFLPMILNNGTGAGNNNTNHYQMTQAQIDEIQKVLPSPEGLIHINNFDNNTNQNMYDNSQKMGILWTGGHYFYDLGPIQDAIQKIGYSVDLNANSTNIMPYYTYQTTGGYANVNINGNTRGAS